MAKTTIRVFPSSKTIKLGEKQLTELQAKPLKLHQEEYPKKTTLEKQP
jgi:hypothetical protein